MSALILLFFPRCRGLAAALLWMAAISPGLFPLALAQTPAGAVESAAENDSSRSPWDALQAPEDALYVVLLRHALAPGVGDPANFTLTDCGTQRNLSAEGEAQARQIGEAFRQRGVVVRALLSSQWCRCLETAALMGVGDVTPFPLLNSFFRERDKAPAQTAQLRQYLQSEADAPGVIVMVTHQVNITALTGIVPRSGQAVVLRLDAGGLEQVGTLSPAG